MARTRSASWSVDFMGLLRLSAWVRNWLVAADARIDLAAAAAAAAADTAEGCFPTVWGYWAKLPVTVCVDAPAHAAAATAAAAAATSAAAGASHGVQSEEAPGCGAGGAQHLAEPFVLSLDGTWGAGLEIFLPRLPATATSVAATPPPPLVCGLHQAETDPMLLEAATEPTPPESPVAPVPSVCAPLPILCAHIRQCSCTQPMCSLVCALYVLLCPAYELTLVWPV